MPPEPGKTEIHTHGGVGSAIESGVAAADKLSKWTKDQLLTVAAIASMIVAYGMILWDKWESRNDRRDEREKWYQAADTISRANDDRDEKSRQFLTAQKELDRKENAANLKMVMGHCAEKDDKLSKAIGLYTAEVQRLIKMKEGKNPD